MPDPYYESDGITIYHGDAREILPTLDDVGIVCADPPYGIDYQSCWVLPNYRKSKIQGDSEFPLWLFDLCKPSVALMVWCRWDILPQLPPPKSFIAWDKGCHSMGDLKHEFGRQWEACAFYPGPEHSFTRRPVDVIRAARVPPDQMMHPNEKPVGAITPLLACHPPATVLDPFMGSGTTLVAAKRLGLKAIGIELEEKYCEIARRRLAQKVLDFGGTP